MTLTPMTLTPMTLTPMTLTWHHRAPNRRPSKTVGG